MGEMDKNKYRDNYTTHDVYHKGNEQGPKVGNRETGVDHADALPRILVVVSVHWFPSFCALVLPGPALATLF